MTKEAEWQNWWTEFLRRAVNAGWSTREGPDVYRHRYFDDGMSPLEAIQEEVRE